LVEIAPRDSSYGGLWRECRRTAARFSRLETKISLDEQQLVAACPGWQLSFGSAWPLMADKTKA
jgi:hypothetical protein